MGGSNHGLFYGAILLFAWMDRGKPRKTFVKIAGLQNEISTWDLPNAKQECHLAAVFGIFLIFFCVLMCNDNHIYFSSWGYMAVVS
jgi:hypothetical protein